MVDKIKERTVYMLCRTDGGNDVYVGSTSWSLCLRLSTHRQRAGNPSRLKYYGGSKLYQKMRELGIQHWGIVPLITFACDRKTICEFKREWVKALKAILNTFSPIDGSLDRRRNNVKYHKKNKETKRYYCELCNVAFMHSHALKKQLDTYKHFMKCVWSVD